MHSLEHGRVVLYYDRPRRRCSPRPRNGRNSTRANGTGWSSRRCRSCGRRSFSPPGASAFASISSTRRGQRPFWTPSAGTAPTRGRRYELKKGRSPAPCPALCCRLLAARLLQLAADQALVATAVTGFRGGRERGGAEGEGGDGGNDQNGCFFYGV